MELFLAVVVVAMMLFGGHRYWYDRSRG